MPFSYMAFLINMFKEQQMGQNMLFDVDVLCIALWALFCEYASTRSGGTFTNYGVEN